MRKYSIPLFVALSVALLLRPAQARAQTITPPVPGSPTPAATGEVTGTIIDQNQGSSVTESQQVMLHIWNQQNNDINMLHAESSSDGTFLFTGVDLQPQYVYGTMAVFDGVTYISQIVPPQEGSNQLQLDVSVYETVQDASAVEVQQLHVLFEFAPDGMQTTEIYALANTGVRTVRDAIKLDDGKTATMRYPLPKDADYIFFQPDTTDRFVKFPGGFADTSPLLPGGQGDRFAVQYMVPYAQEGTFEYTAPVNIKALNFLLPQGSGVALQGEGLAGPQPVTLEAGKSYEVYALSDIHAGQTLHVSLSGDPATGSKPAAKRDLSLPLGLGGGLLGLAMIGVGIWWWRRPGPDEEEEEGLGINPGDAAFEELVARIARLDHDHEQGKVEEDQYRLERGKLKDQAKSMLDHQEEGSSLPGQ